MYSSVMCLSSASKISLKKLFMCELSLCHYFQKLEKETFPKNKTILKKIESRNPCKKSERKYYHFSWWNCTLSHLLV